MKELLLSKSFLVYNIITVFLIINISHQIKAEDNKKYIGKGESIIVNNDIPTAKRNALYEAFKNSIHQAVGVYIKSQTKVENFEMTYSRILGESEGYINNYKIIKEKIKENIYSIEIEALISNDKIYNAFNNRIAKLIEKYPLGPANLVSLNLCKHNKKQIYEYKKFQKSIIVYLDKEYKECLKVNKKDLCSKNDDQIKSINKYFSKINSRIIAKLSFTFTINDPTIDTDSIEIYIKDYGWHKPSISKSGIYSTGEFSVTSNEELLKTLIEIIENNTISIKLKNPENNKKLETKMYFSQIGPDESYGEGDDYYIGGIRIFNYINNKENIREEHYDNMDLTGILMRLRSYGYRSTAAKYIPENKSIGLNMIDLPYKYKEEVIKINNIYINKINKVDKDRILFHLKNPYAN